MDLLRVSIIIQGTRFNFIWNGLLGVTFVVLYGINLWILRIQNYNDETDYSEKDVY